MAELLPTAEDQAESCFKTLHEGVLFLFPTCIVAIVADRNHTLVLCKAYHTIASFSPGSQVHCTAHTDDCNDPEAVDDG